jgi:4-amino-4-deoxy-L-arabinose transferase-like glycosyltransferase
MKQTAVPVSTLGQTHLALTARGRLVAATAVLALCLWLPRGLVLDHFVTADEHAWLARSGNFYYALMRGDWANTFQRHHPGVTVTWAGLGGFLLSYPQYAWDAPGQFGWLTEEIEPFLRSQGHDPVAVLAAGRAVAAALITLTLLGVFWAALRLVGFWPAFLGVGLLAFTPFHVAHSRLLHIDGLVSSFMLLAVTAWLVYLVEINPPERAGQRGRWYTPVLLSAVAAALAWLTRSPAFFLAPLIGLLSLLALWWLPEAGRARPWSALARGLLLWGGVAAAVFVLLWPALWVDPVGSLRQVLDAAEEYAAEGHLKPIFFAGQIYAGDPGFWFYPVTYLWRSSPITWIGLLLALGALLLRRAPFESRRGRFVAAALVLYAVGFMLFMNLGAKKFDRYLLPAYLPLELLGGAGWGALALWACERAKRKAALRYLPLAAGTLVAAQAALALPTFPYYLSYYNPVMGGSRAAPEVMMIGWGEGADEAGRYLDAKPDAANLVVASGYTNGPFSYFFRGRTLPITFWHEADYAVVYAQDWQRQLPSRKAAAYFQQLTPERVVTINGLDYAHIYDLRGAPLPDYVTDWSLAGDEAIRLVSFQLPAAPVTSGETVAAVFYLLNRAPIGTNLNVLVRVVGADGREIARNEGWPWGAATSSWQPGVVWPDGHTLTIPADTPPGYYRVELGFYDPATQELLPAGQAATGAPVGDLVTVDTIQVGELPDPTQPLEPPVALGDQVWLAGAGFQTLDGVTLDPAALTFRGGPGEHVIVDLFWEAQRWMDADYTAFVHLVGPDGQLAAPVDKPPLDGFLPTSAWVPGQRVTDRFVVTVPAYAAPGEYRLYTGMYDPATMTRLPVTRDGTALGDAFPLATITIGE